MAQWALWSPDGQKVLFAWRRSLASSLFWQPPDGRSAMERVTTSDNDQYAGSWSPDGNTVAIAERSSEARYHVGLLDVRSGRVAPFIDAKTDSRHPDFSPDGRFIAYVSGAEVYLRPVSGPDVWPVSGQGGAEPVWARDGRQLFYRSGNQVWAVDVETQGGVRTSKPRLLFDRPGYKTSNPIRCWDVSRDGRFLMVKLDESTPGPVTELTLVQNWFQELERLLPQARR
jgi:Tol biopolymer transport system component